MSIKRLATKQKRKIRVRAKIKGTLTRPRMSVFRANKYIYAQLIDDDKKVTLLTVKSGDIKKEKTKKTKTQVAMEVGKVLASEALKQKISHVVFDRGSSRFHGRIKALADGAREGGLKF